MALADNMPCENMEFSIIFTPSKAVALLLYPIGKESRDFHTLNMPLVQPYNFGFSLPAYTGDNTCYIDVTAWIDDPTAIIVKMPMQQVQQTADWRLTRRTRQEKETAAVHCRTIKSSIVPHPQAPSLGGCTGADQDRSNCWGLLRPRNGTHWATGQSDIIDA